MVNLTKSNVLTEISIKSGSTCAVKNVSIVSITCASATASACITNLIEKF